MNLPFSTQLTTSTMLSAAPRSLSSKNKREDKKKRIKLFLLSLFFSGFPSIYQKRGDEGVSLFFKFTLYSNLNPFATLKNIFFE
jgi:hypothetical protein